jgi:RNA polymerase sigma factor (sigma-70 family)
MGEQGTGHSPYEDWGAVMEALLHGDPDHKQVAFLKLNRLISGLLTASQAWDHRDHWEDLRQIVLMKLVKSFSQGQLRESKAFVVYARTITRNEFYDFLKARGGSVVERVPERTEEEPEDQETVVTVRAAISHLPEAQRRAIEAVYLERRTYEEAASATGIPLGSLKRYLRLGLEQLRKRLAGVLKGE